MSQTIELTLPYGRDSRTFRVPRENLGEVLRPPKVDVPQDATEIIAAALAHPVGSPTLAQVAQGKREAVILVDDLTRPTPVAEILRFVVAELNRAGIPDEQLRIVIALGTHRPMTPEEIQERVGAEMVRRIRVLNSHFHDPAQLRDCGEIEPGQHLWVDRHVVESELRVGIGAILPHPTTGWGGGAKIVYPGVAGAETVSHFHLQQTRLARNVFGDIHSPIRKQVESWVGRLGLHFIVNVVCTTEGKLYRASAGHFIAAHRRGVEYAREIVAVPVQRRAQVVVASSYPADLDFWQAIKGVMSADRLAAEGGTIILLTPCPEGIGPHAELADFVGDEDPERLADRAFAGEFAEPFVVAGGVTLGRVRKRAPFAIVSDGLGPEACARMRVSHFFDLQEAVDWALRRHGPGARVSVVPYAAETVPWVTGEEG